MLQKASVLISKTSKRTRDSVSKKAPFLGLVAFPPGFEPGAFRLGGGMRLFCGVMHNITKSEKSLHYGVFQGDAFRTVSRNIADFG